MKTFINPMCKCVEMEIGEFRKDLKDEGKEI